MLGCCIWATEQIPTYIQNGNLVNSSAAVYQNVKETSRPSPLPSPPCRYLAEMVLTGAVLPSPTTRTLSPTIRMARCSRTFLSPTMSCSYPARAKTRVGSVITIATSPAHHRRESHSAAPTRLALGRIPPTARLTASRRDSKFQLCSRITECPVLRLLKIPRSRPTDSTLQTSWRQSMGSVAPQNFLESTHFLHHLVRIRSTITARVTTHQAACHFPSQVTSECTNSIPTTASPDPQPPAVTPAAWCPLSSTGLDRNQQARSLSRPTPPLARIQTGFPGPLAPLPSRLAALAATPLFYHLATAVAARVSSQVSLPISRISRPTTIPTMKSLLPRPSSPP